jgi:tRNA pseudouridine55 synthase
VIPKDLTRLNGVLVVDKPPGPTSHDVVNDARRALGTRRVGHTGTLDPLASGILPLVIGQATRLSRFLTGVPKGYEAIVRLGVSTDTYDAAGEITARADDANVQAITQADVERSLDAFRGSFEQSPPPFSAKKVGGVRSYALARQRRSVRPMASPVTVHSLELVACHDGRITLRLETSAGFYVRSLAHDIGQRLGCGAHLESLRRYRSGVYTLERAVPLSTLRQDPAGALERLIPMEDLLPDFPGLRLNDAGCRRAAHGNPVGTAEASPGAGGWPARNALVRLLDPAGRLLAIGRVGEGGALQPVVVLG